MIQIYITDPPEKSWLVCCGLVEGFQINGVDTTNITIDNLDNWVYGVSGTGTFTRSSSSSWPTGVSGIPTGWSIIVQ